MIIACLICLVVGVGATLGIGYAFLYDHDQSLVVDHEKQIDELNRAHRDEMRAKDVIHARETVELESAYRDLQTQYEQLELVHQEEMTTSAADFQLLRRYWYVLKEAPNNGTIGLDVLLFADEQCKKWNVNPDWMWHIYQHESQWTTTAINSSSGARGIGQVMPETGRSYWERILGHGQGSFDVSMLDDPFVNIEITVAHIGRDVKNGSSFYDAVNHYSGGAGQSYWNTIISMGNAHGINLYGHYTY